MIELLAVGALVYFVWPTKSQPNTVKIVPFEAPVYDLNEAGTLVKQEPKKRGRKPGKKV